MVNTGNVKGVKDEDCVMKNMTMKRRVATWVPLAAAWVLVGGCASISEDTHAYLGTPRFPPTNPAQVQVLAVEPKQPAVRLGEIVLSAYGNPPAQKLEAKIRAGAAQLGADGVYIVSDQTHIYPMFYWDCWGPAADEEWNRLIVGVAYKNK